MAVHVTNFRNSKSLYNTIHHFRKTLNGNKIYDPYLVNRAKPSVPELVQFREEIRRNLQSSELKKQVPRLLAVVGIISGGGGSAASQSLLQAAAEIGEKPHSGICYRTPNDFCSKFLVF